MNSQNTDRDLLIAALNKNQVTYSQVSKIAEELINGVLKLKTLPMEKEFVFEYMNKKVYIDLNALRIEGLKYLNNILIDDILTSYELNEVYKILDQLKNELLNKADINHTHTSFNKNVTLSNANLMFNQSNAAKDQAITFTNNSDLARIRFYNYDGTKEHGALEIATADDQSEPIYLRQYKYNSGPWNQIGREACLLDASGNTQFPGTVTASNLTSTNETRLAQCEADVANKADVEHTHTISDITDYEPYDDTELKELINTKVDVEHTHTISDINQLSETLNTKADVSHNHDSVYSPINHTHTEYDLALQSNYEYIFTGKRFQTWGKTDSERYKICILGYYSETKPTYTINIGFIKVAVVGTNMDDYGQKDYLISLANRTSNWSRLKCVSSNTVGSAGSFELYQSGGYTSDYVRYGIIYLVCDGYDGIDSVGCQITCSLPAYYRLYKDPDLSTPMSKERTLTWYYSNTNMYPTDDPPILT